MHTSKTVVITGANSGLGLKCAKNIAQSSPEYHIVLACRNSKKAEQAKLEIVDETQNSNITAMELDVASLPSIRKFVEDIQHTQQPIYGLICNAGISGMQKESADADAGLIFRTNHLGNFLLTTLLLPYFESSGRIIMVSSDMHNPPGGIEWIGVEALLRPLKTSAAYSLSKLCSLYFTYELARRLERAHVHVAINAFNPGLMTDTNFFEDKSVFSEDFLQHVADRIGSSDISAKTLAAMMVEEKYSEMNAKYIDRDTMTASSPLSYVEENALELWNASVSLSGLKKDETLDVLVE